MPVSSEEFASGSKVVNNIGEVLKSNPDKAYSLHELEELVVGKEINRMVHLDIFMADLVLMVPLIVYDKKVECRAINGIPYFKWIA